MKLYLFDHSLRLRRWLHLPAMTGKEREIYKKILRSFPDKEEINIFEYGSGYSTVYFARFLKREGIPFRVDAVENNRQWHARVCALLKRHGLDRNVRIHLREFPPFWEKPGWVWGKNPEPGAFAPSLSQEREYVEMPIQLGRKFHLIVVDARFRRRALEVATRCLRPNGVVFLHDAERENYHPELSELPHSHFLDSGKFYPMERRVHRVWLGSRDGKMMNSILRGWVP